MNRPKSQIDAADAEFEVAASHLDAAKENLGEARDALKSGVTDALGATAAAANEAKAEIEDKIQGLLDQGKGMLVQAEDLIRSKPLASFGVAFAAGYLVAALTRPK